MKNILSFKYFRELDQHSIVEDKAVKYNFPDLNSMINEFSKYVKKIVPKDDEMIHIGISFTNNLMKEIYIRGKYTVRSHINPMFWPIYGKVEYEFNKGDFYLNECVDPRKIVRNVNFHGGKWEKFFFTKNPYENKEQYKENFYYNFPDLFDKRIFEFGGPPNLWKHFVDKHGRTKIPKFKPLINYI